MVSSYQRRSLALVMLAAVLATPVAEAGLVYVSQERLVRVGAAPTPTKAASDFGHFDADITAEFENLSGDHAFAQATQSSILGDTFVRASGRVAAASGNDEVDYRVVVAATFDIGAPTTFTLLSSVKFDTFHPNGIFDPSAADQAVYALSLQRVGVGSRLVDERVLAFPIAEDLFHTVSLSRTGMLESGRYELRLELQSKLAEDAEDGAYRLDFRVAPATAVPLPLGAWMGLLTLGGIAGSRLWAARRARAAVAAD
jgi:hypothetical protein